MVPLNAAKTKVQLRLAVQRLRTLQQKKEAQAKTSRRDIATLLERRKIETARIKVEGLINEDIHIELLELLELYCELLLARFGLLDQNNREPDPAINEGVCSIIYAAPRTELKELHTLRDILMHKYGREFSVAVMENRNDCVAERVTHKLMSGQPSNELIDAYLCEIAKAYGVLWESCPQVDEAVSDLNKARYTADEDGPSEVKDEKEETGTSPSATSPGIEKEDDFLALMKRFSDLKRN